MRWQASESTLEPIRKEIQRLRIKQMKSESGISEFVKEDLKEPDLQESDSGDVYTEG